MMWTAENLPALALGAALVTALLAALGEWLHARRVRRIGKLAFGAAGRPRVWTRPLPLIRIAAVAAAAWSIVTLVSFDDRTRESRAGNNVERHLVVMLDVSPSMLLKDAGQSGDITRNARAAEVLKSVLDRLPDEHVSLTAVGFYTEARMLVEKCRDRELLLHLASGTPFHITYKPGKTDILSSVNQTGKFTKDLPRKSATLLILSDGDSLPPTGLEPLPPAIEQVVVVGVGDPARGGFIDGHQSRQDTGNLGQLARRLGGRYYDCNFRPLPREAVESLTSDKPAGSKWQIDRRMAALLLLGSATTLLCLMPVLLDMFGSPWRHRPTTLNPSQPT
jgi:Ca-activated chloride channel family protein